MHKKNDRTPQPRSRTKDGAGRRGRRSGPVFHREARLTDIIIHDVALFYVPVTPSSTHAATPLLTIDAKLTCEGHERERVGCAGALDGELDPRVRLQAAQRFRPAVRAAPTGAREDLAVLQLRLLIGGYEGRRATVAGRDHLGGRERGGAEIRYLVHSVNKPRLKSTMAAEIGNRWCLLKISALHVLQIVDKVATTDVNYDLKLLDFIRNTTCYFFRRSDRPTTKEKRPKRTSRRTDKRPKKHRLEGNQIVLANVRTSYSLCGYSSSENPETQKNDKKT